MLGQLGPLAGIAGAEAPGGDEEVEVLVGLVPLGELGL